MSTPADPVRNPMMNLRTGDSPTAFTCQASFSAATLSPTAVASCLIRPPPSYTSMIRKGYPDRKLLALPTFKNCQSALQSQRPRHLPAPPAIARQRLCETHAYPSTERSGQSAAPDCINQIGLTPYASGF